MNPALLPSGVRDLLPPEAEAEAQSVGRLMKVFASHGYQRVKPPLMEFEDTLLSGAGAALGEQIFRVMDTDGGRLLGVRADTTPQVARIATTRLRDAARPLRLCYAGQCLLARAGGLDPDRQVAQAGLELVGADSAEADAEVIVVAAEGLAALRVHGVSVDLTLPTFLPALLADSSLDPAARIALAHALDRKDAAEVARVAGPHATLLGALLEAAGPAPAALNVLRAAALPDACRALAERLEGIVAALAPHDIKLTLDPVEFRGFRYHSGVALTVYAAGCARELGRGGRYVLDGGEGATGVTLYPDVILAVAPITPGRTRIYVPRDELAFAANLRRDGFATVQALDAGDPVAQARAQNCTHVVRGGAPHALAKAGD